MVSHIVVDGCPFSILTCMKYPAFLHGCCWTETLWRWRHYVIKLPENISPITASHRRWLESLRQKLICSLQYTHRNSQKAKLRSILYYFDKLEAEGMPEGRVTYSRQVMTSKEWLTIEDWLESGQALCPLAIRHEGRLERAENNFLNICFTSSRLGGHVLADGHSQVSRTWPCA